MASVLSFGEPVALVHISALQLLCFVSLDVKAYSLPTLFNGVGERKTGRRRDLKAFLHDLWSSLVERLLSPKDFCRSRGGGVEARLLFC